MKWIHSLIEITISRSVLCGAGFCLVIASTMPELAAQQSDLRTWTNQEGKTVRAELLSMTPTHVNLKLENGLETAVPITTLSAADQTFLKTAPVSMLIHL
jgi:hypothetical protein